MTPPSNLESQHGTRHTRGRQVLAALVASGALLLSGCGIFGDSGSSASEPTGTTIAVKPSKAPTADGQFKTTMKFFPDGTAVSTVAPPDEESYGRQMTNHYSCPASGTHLQIVSHDDYGNYGAAGSTQLIENSAICQDGQVTASDFKLHETQTPGN